MLCNFALLKVCSNLTRQHPTKLHRSSHSRSGGSVGAFITVHNGHYYTTRATDRQGAIYFLRRITTPQPIKPRLTNAANINPASIPSKWKPGFDAGAIPVGSGGRRGVAEITGEGTGEGVWLGRGVRVALEGLMVSVLVIGTAVGSACLTRIRSPGWIMDSMERLFIASRSGNGIP